MEMAVTFHLRSALIVHSFLSDALTVSTAPQDVCRSDLAEELKSPALTVEVSNASSIFHQPRRSLTDSRGCSKLSLGLYGCLVVVRAFGRGAVA